MQQLFKSSNMDKNMEGDVFFANICFFYSCQSKALNLQKKVELSASIKPINLFLILDAFHVSYVGAAAAKRVETTL